MSCPYFYPTESRRGSALFPLGDSWLGECRSDAAGSASVENTVCCNLGYARGQCARFPDTSGPDAVRFTIAADDAEGVRLYYVMERDHHPFAHGPLTLEQDGDPLLKRQAWAYVESYRRRKGDA